MLPVAIEAPLKTDCCNFWVVDRIGLVWRLGIVVRLVNCGNFFCVSDSLGSLSGVFHFPKKLSAPLREPWLDSSRSLEVRLQGTALLIRIWGLNDFVEQSSSDFASTSLTYAGYSANLGLGLVTEA